VVACAPARALGATSTYVIHRLTAIRSGLADGLAAGSGVPSARESQAAARASLNAPAPASRCCGLSPSSFGSLVVAVNFEGRTCAEEFAVHLDGRGHDVGAIELVAAGALVVERVEVIRSI
jgi:hypothetical protein